MVQHFAFLFCFSWIEKENASPDTVRQNYTFGIIYDRWPTFQEVKKTALPRVPVGIEPMLESAAEVPVEFLKESKVPYFIWVEQAEE